MSIVADLFKIIGLVIAIVIVIPLALAAVGYIGYFFGIILSYMAGGILADNFGINRNLIPSIMAWLFILGTLVRSSSGASE